MGFLWWILVGAVAGWIATRVMDLQLGLLQTVLLGMAGAFVGGLILRVVWAALGLFGGLLGAVLGAMALIWIWRIATR